MPDQASTQALEEVDKSVQHVLDLLTQADQALERCTEYITMYNEAHHLNAARGHAISDALKGIQGLISRYTAEHNQFVAQIAEAKLEASQREAVDLGY